MFGFIMLHNGESFNLVRNIMLYSIKQAFLNLCHVLCCNGHEHIVEEVWGLDADSIERQRGRWQGL